MTESAGAADPAGFRVLNEIGIIAQLARNHLASVLPHGLSLSQFTVLNHLERRGEETPSQMAFAIQVSRGTMTNTISRLEAKGFVRVRESADDGRSRLVDITDTGRTARIDAVAATAPAIARMTEALGAGTLEGMIPDLVALRMWLDENAR